MSDTEITSRAQIKQLLTSVHERNIGVMIQPVRSEASAPSMLIGVDSGAQRLYFDAPPGNAASMFQPGHDIVASSRYRGIELRFVSRLEGMTEFEGYPALQATWPRKLEYLQRRRSFRVRVRNLSQSRLDLYTDDRRSRRAELIDISTDGFGAILPDDVEFDASELLDCFVEIGGEGFATVVEIRNVRHNSIGGTIRIGARFAELPKKQRRRLEKLVREVERRAIRGNADQ
jgi:c-di-GMP-binding flagellar brake protein YcgR